MNIPSLHRVQAFLWTSIAGRPAKPPRECQRDAQAGGKACAVLKECGGSIAELCRASSQGKLNNVIRLLKLDNVKRLLEIDC